MVGAVKDVLDTHILNEGGHMIGVSETVAGEISEAINKKDGENC